MFGTVSYPKRLINVHHPKHTLSITRLWGLWNTVCRIYGRVFLHPFHKCINLLSMNWFPRAGRVSSLDWFHDQAKLLVVSVLWFAGPSDTLWFILINYKYQEKKETTAFTKIYFNFWSLSYVDNLYSSTILNPGSGYYTIPDPAHA